VIQPHAPHPLHGADRVYQATGCYIDLLIELLNWRGFEPRAMLSSLIRLDWQDDQFTYVKPRLGDLDLLYGLDVHEMLLYRSLPEHICEQLAVGRFILFEADTFYLPDMDGLAYRIEHLKGQVLVTSIDLERERMSYFHGTGHHELEGEDYRGVFHLLEHFTEDVVDHYAELVTFWKEPAALDPDQVRSLAAQLLVRHYARRARRNPFTAWGESLGGDLERLFKVEHEPSQGYAFLTARMAGSTAELLADHLTWLLGSAGEPAAAPLRRIANGCRTLTFRFARRQPFDFMPAIRALAADWDEMHGRLQPEIERLC
jgi:hypothetical protein